MENERKTLDDRAKMTARERLRNGRVAPVCFAGSPGGVWRMLQSGRSGLRFL